MRNNQFFRYVTMRKIIGSVLCVSAIVAAIVLHLLGVPLVGDSTTSSHAPLPYVHVVDIAHDLNDWITIPLALIFFTGGILLVYPTGSVSSK